MEVIVRTTFACNGTCAYCSAASVPSAARASERLDPAQLRPLFERFRDWLAEGPRRTVRFQWFGGEPLMMGRAFYRRVIDEQRAVFGDPRGRVRNILQTNLSLLDEAWIPVLRELLQGEVLGTSYDPVEGVRGVIGRRSLTDRFLPAIELLRRSGIRWGLIYVVHRGSLGRARELYHFTRNLEPDSVVRFNPLCHEGRAREGAAEGLAITPEEYGAFLVELLDAWRENGERGHVPPVSDWVRAFRGEPAPLVCDCAGRCASTHLEVDPDGAAFLCSRASDAGEPPMGNVFREPISQIFAHEKRRLLATRTALLREGECAGCAYFGLCHGGCPMAARQYHDDYLRKTWWCEARRLAFGAIEERLGHAPRWAAP